MHFELRRQNIIHDHEANVFGDFVAEEAEEFGYESPGILDDVHVVA